MQLGGVQAFVKATSEQSDGAFNLFVVSCLPGYATALHIHYAEDVAIYVLEGVLTIFWSDEKRTAGDGCGPLSDRDFGAVAPMKKHIV